ncbi:TolC family protein [candidate division KSB1 bacterium]
MKIRLITFLLILIFLVPSVYAQETRELTYDNSLEIAIISAYTFKQQENNFKRDYYNLLARRAGMKSYATMDIQVPAFDERITEIYSYTDRAYKFVNSQTIKYQITTRIRQPIITGGELSINGDLSHTNQYGRSQKYFGRLYFAFEQPILQPNELRNDILEAEWTLEKTRLSYATRKSGTISWLTGIFYDLFRFQKLIDFKENLLLDSQEIFNRAEGMNRAGTLDDTELLQLQVDLENLHGEIEQLRADRKNREETFKQQIGLSRDENVAAIADMNILPRSITLDEAIQRGLENRVEMKRFVLDIKEKEIEINETKSEGGLTGELRITFGFDNTVNGELFNAEFYDPLGQIFENYDRSRSAMITFKLPVLDWGRNAASLQSKYIDMERTKNRQINTALDIRKQISDSYYSLQETITRHAVSKESEANAKRIYDLTKEQFNNGQVTAQQMRLAKDGYVSAYDKYFAAYVDYKKALIALNNETMWDFQNDISLVTEDEIQKIISKVNNENNNN